MRRRRGMRVKHIADDSRRDDGVLREGAVRGLRRVRRRRALRLHGGNGALALIAKICSAALPSSAFGTGAPPPSPPVQSSAAPVHRHDGAVDRAVGGVRQLRDGDGEFHGRHPTGVVRVRHIGAVA